MQELEKACHERQMIKSMNICEAITEMRTNEIKGKMYKGLERHCTKEEVNIYEDKWETPHKNFEK